MQRLFEEESDEVKAEVEKYRIEVATTTKVGDGEDGEASGDDEESARIAKAQALHR